MKKIYFLFIIFYCNSNLFSQNWSTFTDSIATLSSARGSDLNGDGILDIVIGGGTDSTFSTNGIMAYNGLDGTLLWKRESNDEIFGSAIFQDINNDGINDVFISGRSAQLIAIDGFNGALIWEYFPYNSNPADSGLYNFYNPQFIDDVDGDSLNDLIISNGGDHSAPAWQQNRPPGHLMIISSLTGNLIVKSVVPDSAETYCSPIIADLQNNGEKWILYGTGGENIGGNFYAVKLNDLLLGDISASILLESDNDKGYIAPPSIYKSDLGHYNIIIQSFGGKITKISGQNFTQIWTFNLQGTESSAQPVIGNFTGDLTPDVFLILFNGIAPSYSDFFQVMLDGSDGTIKFIDSLGTINYASANAVDLNNDGRDEAVILATYLDNGFFKSRVESIDFTTNTITSIDQSRTGVNISSTPLITDIDNDGHIDLVYTVKKDSLNPMGWKGITMYRKELSSILPNSGISWGSYLGTYQNGIYNNQLINCGNNSIITNINKVHPSCNGYSDGSIGLNLSNGLPPFTFLWSNQNISNSIHNLSADVYWVYVTDSLGCYEYRTINLTDPFVIAFGGITQPTCPNDSNGIATLGSSGCPCMFSGCTYLWENGITTKTNNNLPVGWSSVEITHVNGCVVIDSVLINQSMYDNSTGTSIVSTCNSFSWDSIVYSSSGTYINTYTNSFGCDSIHTLHLNINSDNEESIVTTCDSYTWDGVVYTISGIYSNTYTNIFGCDSIHTLNLTITNSSTGFTDTTVCDSYVWNGVVYDSTGSYTNTFNNSIGCDSIHTLILTINYSNNIYTNFTACGSYNWPLSGLDYHNSGTYEYIDTNSMGCIDTNVLNLTINPIYSFYDTTFLCEGDSITIGNNTYYNSGVYTNYLISINNCDSTLTNEVIFNTTPISQILQSGYNLVANINITNYSLLWSTGDTTEEITPSNDGNYWLITTDRYGCKSDTSYFNVDWISTNTENIDIENINIYPNPSNSYFKINFVSKKSKEINLTITNSIGEYVYKRDIYNNEKQFDISINLNNYSKGIYLLRIENNYGILHKKLILH